MSHPLDGARLKVVRAQKHLESLKDEIGRYLGNDPYEFPAEHESDAVTAKPAIVKVEPPLDLGCIIGDCLANLRPSLDYIAWELASQYSPAPLVPKKDRIYFPLNKEAAGFNTNARPHFVKYCVPAVAIDLMESVQPYQAGYEPLGLLSDLVNEDKHRLPLLTVAYLDTASIRVTVEGPPVGTCVMHPPGSGAIISGYTIVRMEVRRLTPEEAAEGRFEASCMIGGVPAAPDAPSPGPSEQQSRSVKVDGQVTFFVALKNAPMPLVPVERTLEQVVKCVASIVPRFEPFFP
jgi:hypothetical protein